MSGGGEAGGRTEAARPRHTSRCSTRAASVGKLMSQSAHGCLKLSVPRPALELTVEVTEVTARSGEAAARAATVLSRAEAGAGAGARLILVREMEGGVSRPRSPGLGPDTEILLMVKAVPKNTGVATTLTTNTCELETATRRDVFCPGNYYCRVALLEPGGNTYFIQNFQICYYLHFVVEFTATQSISLSPS